MIIDQQAIALLERLDERTKNILERMDEVQEQYKGLESRIREIERSGSPQVENIVKLLEKHDKDIECLKEWQNTRKGELKAAAVTGSVTGVAGGFAGGFVAILAFFSKLFQGGGGG